MRTYHPLKQQQGISLLFSLVALVALLFGALAMVRNLDTASILMGNLGLKQDATASADQATRQAITWLNLNAGVLNTDLPASGYYASNQEFASDGTTARDPIDATGDQLKGSSSRQLIDWNNDNCAYAAGTEFSSCSIKPKAIDSAINGNAASYVILRLCSKAGNPNADNTISCAKPVTSAGGTSNSRNSLDSASATYTGSSTTYFRVLVRVDGARNSTSVTETIVHF